MRVTFHPDARRELTEAAEYYEGRLAGLGLDLNVEVERTAALLSQTPGLGVSLDGRHRRFPVQRFPFALIYREDRESLVVVAVAHKRRRPGYWVGRT
jgi:plasmid stabilization system protein ParE